MRARPNYPRARARLTVSSWVISTRQRCREMINAHRTRFGSRPRGQCDGEQPQGRVPLGERPVVDLEQLLSHGPGPPVHEYLAAAVLAIDGAEEHADRVRARADVAHESFLETG